MVNKRFNKPRLSAPVSLALTTLDHQKAPGQNSKKCLPRERVAPLASRPGQLCLPAPSFKAYSPKTPVVHLLDIFDEAYAQGQSSKKDLLRGHCALLPSSGQPCLPAPVSKPVSKAKAGSPKTPVGLELMLLDKPRDQGPNSKKVLVVGDTMLRLRPGERRLLKSPVPMAIVPAGTKPDQRTGQNSKLMERSLVISKPLALTSSVPSVEEVEEEASQDQTDPTVAEPKKSLWQTVTQPKVLKVAAIILGVAAMVALGGVVAASYYAPIVTFAQTPAVVQAGNFVAHYTTHQLVPAAAQAGRFVALNTHKLLIVPGFENVWFFATMAMHTAIIPAAKAALPVVLPVISTAIVGTLAVLATLYVANRVWQAVKGVVWGAITAVAHAFGRELDKTYVGMAAKAVVTTVAAPLIEAFEMEDFEDKKEEAVPQPSLTKKWSDDLGIEDVNQENALVEKTSKKRGEKPQRSLANRVASYALWAAVFTGAAYLYISRGNAGLNQLPAPQPLPVVPQPLPMVPLL
ncbi:MAG TPA: hypothetical protein VFU89_01370 [Rhabdochlamydiaceae bacterium]|nr:hypothetical protein [Rhabdochlamydiaceae bacterium]